MSGSGEVTLREIIDERLEQFKKSGEKRSSPKYRYMLKLSDLVDRGVVLTVQDREFLDQTQPDRKIRRCVFVSARGKCPIGYGNIGSGDFHDRCPHWGDWYHSKVTCEGYEPEEIGNRRF